LRQNANTRDLIFDVPTLVAVLSASITLYPGDIIATGTPAGVGIGFKPPRYLKEGDTVAIEIAGLGRLENSVVARAGGAVDPVVARLLGIRSSQESRT
jgi:2-keto-4-pentenoate hydratase/2-oxohepta-3-ene-1,7-dioic acid hydratase in catechol pathway